METGAHDGDHGLGNVRSSLFQAPAGYSRNVMQLVYIHTKYVYIVHKTVQNLQIYIR